MFENVWRDVDIRESVPQTRSCVRAPKPGSYRIPGALDHFPVLFILELGSGSQQRFEYDSATPCFWLKEPLF